MRLFAALTPPLAVREEIAEAAREWLGDRTDVRPVDAARVHLTLAFLGEVRASEVPEARDRLQVAVVGHRGFDLTTTGWGRFPPCGRPRIYWLGLQMASGLGEVARSVRAALTVFNPELADHELAPHLTVARARRGGGRRLPEVPEETAVHWSWRVDEVELIRSRLGEGPARYQIVDRCRLEDGQAVGRRHDRY